MLLTLYMGHWFKRITPWHLTACDHLSLYLCHWRSLKNRFSVSTCHFISINWERMLWHATYSRKMTYELINSTRKQMSKVQCILLHPNIKCWLAHMELQCISNYTTQRDSKKQITLSWKLWDHVIHWAKMLKDILWGGWLRRPWNTTHFS